MLDLLTFLVPSARVMLGIHAGSKSSMRRTGTGNATTSCSLPEGSFSFTFALYFLSVLGVSRLREEVRNYFKCMKTHLFKL